MCVFSVGLFNCSFHVMYTGVVVVYIGVSVLYVSVVVGHGCVVVAYVIVCMVYGFRVVLYVSVDAENGVEYGYIGLLLLCYCWYCV